MKLELKKSIKMNPPPRKEHWMAGNVPCAVCQTIAGSIDQRLPNQFIGQLRPEILTVP